MEKLQSQLKDKLSLINEYQDLSTELLELTASHKVGNRSSLSLKAAEPESAQPKTHFLRMGSGYFESEITRTASCKTALLTSGLQQKLIKDNSARDLRKTALRNRMTLNTNQDNPIQPDNPSHTYKKFPSMKSLDELIMESTAGFNVGQNSPNIANLPENQNFHFHLRLPSPALNPRKPFCISPIEEEISEVFSEPKKIENRRNSMEEEIIGNNVLEMDPRDNSSCLLELSSENMKYEKRYRGNSLECHAGRRKNSLGFDMNTPKSKR